MAEATVAESAAVAASTTRVPDDVSELAGLTITADPGSFACRVTLHGRLDFDTVPVFTTCLETWTDRGLKRIVVDLAGITDMDHAGARALAQAAHVLGRGGGSLTVVAPHRLVDGPLADCGLELIEPGPDAVDDSAIGVRRVR
jgi:anti-anti-sigma factor